MKIRVKIIPDDGPVEVYEFASYVEAYEFFEGRQGPTRLMSRDEEAAEILKNGFTTSYIPESEKHSLGVPADCEACEHRDKLSPVDKPSGGFIKRLFGIK